MEVYGMGEDKEDEMDIGNCSCRIFDKADDP